MASDKTEKPTPKRREEARKKGQVARSVDVNSAVVLLATLAALALAGPWMLRTLGDGVRTGLAQAGDPAVLESDAHLDRLARWGIVEVARPVAPIALVALITGVLVSIAQVRPRLTPAALKPTFKKLDPVAGAKRVFGPNGLFEAGKALAKTAAVAVVAFLAVWPELPALAGLVGLDPAALPEVIGAMVWRVGLKATLALLVLAAIDYVWQRRRHEKSLRMSLEEVRREARQTDVSPEVRKQVRRRQLEAARRRMLADVPSADVVVTNPTHYAVALRYDGSLPAPEVVAKGVDLVAQAIRDVAREHGVPVLENAPLARALYRDVDLGHTIPDRFFAAVAELLAFVYRTSGRRTARP
jgi:flagellar biosynthetic protein FlhB